MKAIPGKPSSGSALAPAVLPKLPVLTVLAMLLVGILTLSAASCAPEPVSGFEWRGPRGERVEFSAAWQKTARRVDGDEGRWRASDLSAPAGTSLRRFQPARPLAVPGGRAVRLSFRVHGGNIPVSIGIASKKGGKPAPAATAFLAETGEFLAFMEMPQGGQIAEISISPGLAGPADAAGAGAEDVVLELEKIAVVPPFSGFRRSQGRLEVSSGFSSKGESGTRHELTVSAPPAGTDAEGTGQALVLEYGGSAAADIELKDNAGGRLLLRAQSPVRRAILTPELFAAGATRVTARFPSGLNPLSFHSSSVSAADAEFADLGRIVLAGGADGQGSDFRLYRWDVLPDVLVFDFKDYATQDAYLKRLAFFVEKEGFRGRLASDSEISGLHGWNAHDYRAQDLAAFFGAARRKAFPLNPSEKRLESLLLSRGVISKAGDGYAAGRGAILSISRESPEYLRRTFITHESVHAVFFADAAYAEFATALWNGMEAGEKWFWTLYFDWMHYDVSSGYLMANEVQAYLAQQPVAKAAEYFTKTLPPRVLETNPEFKDRIVAYMAAYGGRFEERARQVDGWLRAKYGFGAGRTYFLR